MTLGMPAITMTLPIQKPGAAEILLSTSSPPTGTRVMRMRASFITPPVWATRACMISTARGWIIDGDAERLGDAFGGNVVVGRADAAGGEHIGVARAQRIYRGDDLRLFVGDDAHFLEIDADAGEIFGDVADVLVLGAARQDLVADHEDGGGDDPAVGLARAIGQAIGHGLSVSVLRLL